MLRYFVLLFYFVLPIHANSPHIAITIDDPQCDQLASEYFNSPTFVNQVLNYSLEGQHYQVRIIYNPEGFTFNCTRDIYLKLESGKILREFTAQWNVKYGIITNKEAPEALVDHLWNLANPSFWDRYTNFAVYNGTYVQCREYSYETGWDGSLYQYETAYPIDTWFNFTENLCSP